MSIKFEKPSEAFAAVITIIVAADKLGTMDERDFIFDQVKNINVFENYSQAEFAKLLEDSNQRVYETLPMDGVSFTRQGIESLAEAAREVLSLELRVEVFRMAAQLVRADKLSDEEETMLKKLQRGLEIDKNVAQDILAD